MSSTSRARTSGSKIQPSSNSPELEMSIHHGSRKYVFETAGHNHRSDLVIRCGLETFEVHSAILCPKSKFFAAACKGPFLVGLLSNFIPQAQETKKEDKRLKLTVNRKRRLLKLT